MEFMNYLLVALIAYAGLYIGAFISFFTKEELAEGKKYFILMTNLLLALAFGLVLYHFNINLGIVILASMIGFILLYSQKKLFPVSSYVALAIIFYVTSVSSKIFLAVSSVIFIYGLAAGSIIAEENIKKKKKDIFNVIFRSTLWFPVFVVILFFLRT